MVSFSKEIKTLIQGGNELLRRLGLSFLSGLDMVKLRRLVASTG